MKRFLSHYLFIYPSTLLKLSVLTIHDDGQIIDCYPFDKEIAATSFYNGLLFVLPHSVEFDLSVKDLSDCLLAAKQFSALFTPNSEILYSVYTCDGLKLC